MHASALGISKHIRIFYWASDFTKFLIRAQNFVNSIWFLNKIKTD